MKKILVLAVITVLGFANVNAQEIKFGVKGGLNFSTVSGDNTENIDYVTSYNIGVVSEIPLSEKFSFQPEILYSRQGYSFNNDVVALNYLNVPLIGKYYITKGFSVEAGPQIGFLLSAKNEKVNVKDSFNTFDFGVNFGLGYKLENGLNFGARYNLGLTDINNIEGSSSKNKNGVFQISVGYFFF
ncbi:outer membrane protein with beta-barrel domain [Flavobacterium sp. 270]|uniref:porin family protein n=1 Tax=Flavobacterium sp. 270 TaxID=2512114 RepID=UPI001065E7AE|nr:porin family protein [Flavobacterium sp. 270]TDW46612.1 outer membrane protein with beta-barrel domain [Flavobacterium sp. 270]